MLDCTQLHERSSWVRRARAECTDRLIQMSSRLDPTAELDDVEELLGNEDAQLVVQVVLLRLRGVADSMSM